MTLLWILLIPFIGGLLCWQMERLGGQFVRWVALASMSACLVLSCAIWLGGDFTSPTPASPSGQPSGNNPGSPLRHLPAPRRGRAVAPDGDPHQLHRRAGHPLFLEGDRPAHRLLPPQPAVDPGGVLGVFMAVDLFLFFFFWEMMLVPMYFLIALWGHWSPMASRASTPPPSSSSTPRRAASSCWWPSWAWY